VVAVADQTADKWPAGVPLRVSDDGNMAVEQGSAAHLLWAASSQIDSANTVLKAVGSGVELEKQASTLKGVAPEGGEARTLNGVHAKNLVNQSAGAGLTIGPDCGNVARNILGAKGAGDLDKVSAQYRTVTSDPQGQPLMEGRETAASQPEGMKAEILETILAGSSTDAALAAKLESSSKALGAAKGAAAVYQYENMPEALRDKLDEQAGLNKYVKPALGEGYAINRGITAVAGKGTWNFHWGGVILSSGDDRVTLENFGNKADTEWGFNMYGTVKAGQTFHEQALASGEHGTKPVTMKVYKRPAP